MLNYKTEKPYALTTASGNFREAFYTEERAVAAAKAEKRAVRRLYGRHRGYWKFLAEYRKGVRVMEVENAN